MKDVFKNMRGAGLGGLLLMAVVFAVSVVLAGGLYFAKISRGMELNELNDEISAHRTIAPVVASLKARRVETEKLLTPAAVYDMPKDVRGLLKTLRVVAQDAGLHNTQFLPDAISVVVALREDADIVVVGEMRDRETVRLALQAAETGHLVFATLHTRTAAQSVDRIISIFPEAEQAQMRMVLADTLKAVLSVSLMKRCDIKGRVQAMEIMLVNGAIRNLIREGKTPQINSVIQTSRGQGMCTMDDALKDLLDRGIISRETAAHYARDSDFLKDVRRI